MSTNKKLAVTRPPTSRASPASSGAHVWTAPTRSSTTTPASVAEAPSSTSSPGVPLGWASTGCVLPGVVLGTGLGLTGRQDIREIYNYICNNYVDGDEVILTGFSRGAFTARSVADMIASVGLCATPPLPTPRRTSARG